MRKEMGVVKERLDESGNVKSVDLAKFVVSDLAKYAKEKHNVSLTIKYLNGMAEDMTDIGSFEQKFLLNAIKNKDVVNTLELQRLADELDYLINNSDDEVEYETH